MSGSHRAALLVAATALSVVLTGCDTLGLDFGSPSTPAPPAQRALDNRNDDLANLVFAVDLPTSLKVVPGSSVASFDATNAQAGKHVKASLVLADGDAVDAVLPGPAAGRSYFLLGFSERDKTALRAAQQWLKALPPDAAPVTVLQVAPRFCAIGPVDPAETEISILPAVPNAPPLLPLVAPEPLSMLLAQTGGSLTPCSAG